MAYPYDEIIRVVRGDGKHDQCTICIGKVTKIAPLSVTAESLELDSSDLIFIEPLGQSISAQSTDVLSAGDELLLLTNDHQIYYVVGKTARYE